MQGGRSSSLTNLTAGMLAGDCNSNVASKCFADLAGAERTASSTAHVVVAQQCDGSGHQTQYVTAMLLCRFGIHTQAMRCTYWRATRTWWVQGSSSSSSSCQLLYAMWQQTLQHALTHGQPVIPESPGSWCCISCSEDVCVCATCVQPLLVLAPQQLAGSYQLL
jgi:hypothetical protein